MLILGRLVPTVALSGKVLGAGGEQTSSERAHRKKASSPAISTTILAALGALSSVLSSVQN